MKRTIIIAIMSFCAMTAAAQIHYEETYLLHPDQMYVSGTLNDDSVHIGNWTWWHPNGQVFRQGKYDNQGHKTGVWRTFYNDGTKHEETVMSGSGTNRTWYPSGTGDEYVVDAAHAGNVTIYFKSTSQADWSAFGGYMYIDNGSTPDVPTEAPTDAPADTVTVYFTDALNWGSVNVYYWPNGGAWPGSAAEKYEVNGYSQQVYKATIPASVDGLIFNGGGKQTVDITSGITDGAQWYTVNTTDASGHYNVALVGDEPTPTEAPTPSSNDVVFEPGDAGAGSPAWFAWVYNGSKADQWIQGTTDGSGNVTFPGAGDFGGMVIVRMPTGSTSGAWSGYWNRTGDITIQKGKTLYFTGWNNDYFNTAWK